MFDGGFAAVFYLKTFSNNIFLVFSKIGGAGLLFLQNTTHAPFSWQHKGFFHGY